MRGGDERRTGDDEAEREHARSDPERAGPDRIAEDQDAAKNRGSFSQKRGLEIES